MPIMVLSPPVSGRCVFILPLPFMMLLKVMGMTICWADAIFIAPIGLAWLYYHHTKQEKIGASDSQPANVASGGESTTNSN